jgi:hypothetical protein
MIIISLLNIVQDIVLRLCLFYAFHTVGKVLQYRVFRLQYRILKMEDYLLGGQVGDFYSGPYYK